MRRNHDMSGNTAEEIELGLLASCWMDVDNTRLLLGAATVEDFHVPSARQQFEVLRRCWQSYKMVEIASLRKVSADLGFVESCARVWEAFDTGNWTGFGKGQLLGYLDQVREETGRFNFIKALEKGAHMMRSSALPLDDAKARVSSLLTKAAGAGRQSAEHWSTGLGKLAEEVREDLRLEAEGKPPSGRVMMTGIDTLDQIMGGTEESDYVVVAARTGVGKTAFSLGVATHFAANYGSVLFCSLELSRPKMWRRVAVQQSQFPLKVVARRPDLIDRAREVNANLWIDDTPLRPSQLQQRIELFRLEHPDLCCVFIDHLGIFADPPRLFEQTSAASHAVRDAMKATGLPIVALVQINRNANLRDGGRPTSADLRMSGDIEQDARKIILLHRPPLYRPEGQGDPFEAVAIVAKNGEGATGDAALRYNGPLFTFLPGYAPGPKDEDAPSFPTHNAPAFEDVDLDGLY